MLGRRVLSLLGELALVQFRRVGSGAADRVCVVLVMLLGVLVGELALTPAVIGKGMVRVLVTRSPMSDGPMGDPRPVAVLAVAPAVVVPELAAPDAKAVAHRVHEVRRTGRTPRSGNPCRTGEAATELKSARAAA